jgi:signal transduction histidine kinase
MVMLRQFVTQHRDEIVARCRARDGIESFLDHLEHALASELGGPAGADAAATRHGAASLHHGSTIAEVVHDYGDVCQVITQLSIDCHVAVTTEEFRVLNRCVDDAIADAVTEYERQHVIEIVADDMRRSNEQLGSIAHELRTVVCSALLAYDVVRSGTVGIAGSTGDMLGRSLIMLRDLVDRSLADVRLSAGVSKPERISVAELVDEVEVSASLGAKARRIQLTVNAVEPELVLIADRQILGSVLSGLLQNAFAHTRSHSRVRLFARATEDRVRFEVEDQCGGLAPGGEAAGLAVCARGVAALRGSIHVRNVNRGCVFTVELPRAAASAQR